MPTPRRPKPRTRVVVIDGEVFLLKWKRKNIVETRRLTGFDRELALRMLDDIQAEIEAHVLGGKAS